MAKHDEELGPLVAHLESGVAVSEPTVFPRGTLLPDGRLDLCKQGLGSEGAAIVARALRSHRFVSSLLLGADSLHDEGARSVAGLIATNDAVTTLFVGCNLIEREGANAIANAVDGHRTLRGLWLKRNDLGEGARAIARAVRSAPKMRTLDLAQTSLAHGAYVAEMLADHPSLERLYLSGNALGPESADWLAEILRSNLRALFLSANRLGDDGLLRLLPALRANRHLEELSLGSNGLTEVGLRALADALEGHPTLRVLDLAPSPSGQVLGALDNALDEGSLFARFAARTPEHEDVAAIRSVYRTGGRRLPAAKKLEEPTDRVAPPSAEDLERCAETLRALADHPELVPASVRAGANRLVAAIQTQSRDAKHARALDERVRAKAARRAHDGAILAATTIRSSEPEALASRTLRKPRECYVCKAAYTIVDTHYDSLCTSCAKENLEKRIQRADLRGRRALVTGGRVKIGYQIALGLLRAGAEVVVTTRFPCDAAQRYAREPDFSALAERLTIEGIDLRDLGAVDRLAGSIVGPLDILINNAAQTVRRPPAFYRHLLEVERAGAEALPPAVAKVLSSHRHHAASAHRLSQLAILPGDLEAHDFPPGALDRNGQQIDLRANNSWNVHVEAVDRHELVEVHHVNAFAPFVLVSRLLPQMLASPRPARFVVNVSAMEGKFDYAPKRPNHPHTNMAKAALNMLTRTSGPMLAAQGIYMTSVDTGWITNEQPFAVAARMRDRYGFVLPLTEEDGAARVLDPVLSAVNGAPPVHSVFLKDYRVTSW